MQKILLALFLFSGLTLADPPAASPIPDGYELVFSDEFDNAAKFDDLWQSENGSPGHITSSRWRENIEITDGLCRLVQRKEQRGGKEWTSAHFWSRREFTYGYYESRYRYADAPGINNALWLIRKLHRDTQTPGQFEVDINEGHHPNEINTNLHNWSGKHWGKGRALKADGNLAAEFHTYGLLWTETELVWYFDGKEIRRESHEICRLPASLRFSTAVMPWAGEITDRIHNTAMEVDYVRVYQPR